MIRPRLDQSSPRLPRRFRPGSRPRGFRTVRADPGRIRPRAGTGILVRIRGPSARIPVAGDGNEQPWLYRRGNGSAGARRGKLGCRRNRPRRPAAPIPAWDFFWLVCFWYRPDTMLVPFWYDGGVAMTLRLPDELREALGVEAASSGRSVHAEILFRLRESVGQYVTRSGRVLTDADVEALADEAEVGYDVSGLSAPEGSARSQQRARVGAGAEPPAATVSPGPDGVDAERVVPSRLGCPMDTPHGVKCKVCGKVH
jgi:hypothetical protein